MNGDSGERTQGERAHRCDHWVWEHNWQDDYYGVKCAECGREMPPITAVEIKPVNCPRCGGFWISIPRMGIYHVCPDGNGPTQEDWLKAGLFSTVTTTTSPNDSKGDDHA